jgi:hypothetical protein
MLDRRLLREDEGVQDRNAYMTCFSELGRAFSTCRQLTLDLQLGNGAMTSVEMLAQMTSRMTQVRTVMLFLPASLEEDAPFRSIAGLLTSPNLEEVELWCSVPAKIHRVCQDMMTVTTLKSFKIGRLSLARSGPFDTIVEDLSRLLWSNRLTNIELRGLVFGNEVVSQTLAQSIVAAAGLKEVSLDGLSFAENENGFYESIGRGLPRMKNLEELVIYQARDDGQDALGVSAACQQTLLQGVRFTTNLVELELPICSWTEPLVQSLADCLTVCSSLRELTIRDSGRSEGTSDFSALSLALSKCSLLALSCHFVHAADFCAVATGVALNCTIESLSLTGPNPGLGVDTLSQVCHALRPNLSLKELSCSSEPETKNAFGNERILYPEALQRLLGAISDNFRLEHINLCQQASWDEDLSDLIHVITRLNKEGRQYVKYMDDPNFTMRAFCLLEAVNDSIDCLYVHLRDVPSLFCR